MSFFVVFIAVVTALLSLFIHRRVGVAPGWSRGVRRAIGMVLALGWALVLVAFAMQSGVIDPHRARWAAWAGMTWLAVFWYLLLGSLVIGIVSLAARLIGRKDFRRAIARVFGPVVIVGALGTTAYGVWEAATPRVTESTFTSPQLPTELDGLRVALVSDTHVGPVRDDGFTRRVVELVNGQRPDIVMLAGDLIDGKVSQVSDSLAPMSALEAPLGVFAVSGNHEFISQEAVTWMDYWETLGMKVLRNENAQVTRGDGAMRVAGINDRTATGVDAADVGKALTGVPAQDFTLFMAHQPLAAESAQGRGIDLQLSGHTHGGQIWPFRYLVLLQQPTLEGLADVGDVPVFTTRGAGAWGPPVRVLAPPEISMITLRRGG